MKQVKLGSTFIATEGSIQIDFDLNKFFDYYTKDQTGNIFENYSPIAQKRIGAAQQNNIIIAGDFRTDFDAEIMPGYDGMAYITVRRNSIGTALAHCGYGIAFRPSSPNADIASTIDIGGIHDNGDGTYDIDLVSAIGFTPGGGLAYINQGEGSVAFHYESIDTNTLENCSFPTNIIPEEGDDISMAADNVFIVDNDLIGSDIYNHHQIEYDRGVMSYIKSTVAEIKKDTKYYYQLSIGSNNSISFKINEDKSALGGSGDIITGGAYSPLAEYLETPDMDAFGVSVVNTNGYKWYWGPMRISNMANEYPVVYFEMNVLEMPDKVRAYIRGRGVGYDGGNIKYGLNLYAWNAQAGPAAWELIASNEFEDMSGNNIVIVSLEMGKSDFAIDNEIKFYCTSKYPSGSLVDQNAFIDIDTFYLMASVNNSVHVGSCIDIYIDDPYLKKETIQIAASADYIEIPEFENRAVVLLDSVNLIMTGDNIPLIEGIDYLWHVNDERYRNSVRVLNILKFTTGITGNIEIIYYYSPLTKSSQDLSEDIYVSYEGHDVLVKHMGIHLLEIVSNLSDAHTYLQDYIDQLTVNSDGGFTLDWTNFYNYLLSQDLEVETLEITDTHRDGINLRKEFLHMAGDTVTIQRIETFKIRGIFNA